MLIACECSGAVRDAFRALGHDAWSCDLLPSNDMRFHNQCDVIRVLDMQWDLMIGHPPCGFLTNSAAWAYSDPNFDRYPGVGYHQKVKLGTLTGARRRAAREESIQFFQLLLEAPIDRIALENPTGVISTRIRKPEQIIQPHQFGEDASKGTCLWLKNLPPLVPTKHIAPRIVDGKPRWSNQTDSGQNKLSPSRTRAADRAVTYPGIAAAMAHQWGGILF